MLVYASYTVQWTCLGPSSLPAIPSYHRRPQILSQLNHHRRHDNLMYRAQVVRLGPDTAVVQLICVPTGGALVAVSYDLFHYLQPHFPKSRRISSHLILKTGNHRSNRGMVLPAFIDADILLTTPRDTPTFCATTFRLYPCLSRDLIVSTFSDGVFAPCISSSPVTNKYSPDYSQHILYMLLNLYIPHHHKRQIFPLLLSSRKIYI